MSSIAVAADLFVSHSSADKSDVGRYVSELKDILASRGHALTVFIDRPLEIETLNPADMFIPVNADWERTLDQQLNGCRATIVFWSAASMKSDWVLKEAERSFEDKSDDDEPKLFHVTLDDAGADHLGRQFMIRKTQACRLHKLLDDSSRSAALGLLAASIVAYLAKPRKQSASVKAPVEVLPYLINCASQVRAIGAGLQSIFERGDDGIVASPSQRPIFALAGYPEDSPEDLVSRIVKHDLPALCRTFDLPSDLQPETRGDRVNWRRDGSRPGAAMQRDILNFVKYLGRRRERPVLVTTTIYEPEQADSALLNEWLTGWTAAMGQFPDAGSIPLLVVVEKAPGWFSRRSVADALLDRVQTFDQPAARGISLERLPQLNIADAHAWRDTFLPFGRDHELHIGVSDFIRLQFSKAGREPRIAEFARSVIGQSWWHHLKRYYGG